MWGEKRETSLETADRPIDQNKKKFFSDFDFFPRPLHKLIEIGALETLLWSVHID